MGSKRTGSLIPSSVVSQKFASKKQRSNRKFFAYHPKLKNVWGPVRSE
jgi:hypothetical protein